MTNNNPYNLDLFITLLFKFRIPLVFFSSYLIYFFIKGVLLTYPDLFHYPFMTPDSHDWISNGLHLLGYDVFYSFRNPGLPLLIAVLYKYNILFLLPFLNQITLFSLILSSYYLIKHITNPFISLLFSLFLFLNFFLQSFSLFILADLYATLFMIIGFDFYLKAKEREKYYYFCSLSLSISFLFQYAIYFQLPAVILHFYLYRNNISIKHIIYYSFPFMFVNFIWFTYKYFYFGTFLYSGVMHVELLKFHLDSILTYAINVISILGIPTSLVLLSFLFFAFLNFLNKQFLDEIIIFCLYNITCWVFVWVFLYDWNDKRFTIYLIVFAGSIAFYQLSFFYNWAFRNNSYYLFFPLLLTIFMIYYSSTKYDSPHVLNQLNICSTRYLEFQTIQKRSASLNITLNSNISIITKYNDFGSLYYLYERRKASQIRINLPLNFNYYFDIPCVEYESYEPYKWYSDRNLIANYVKMKPILYPKCDHPNIFIGNDNIIKLN